jgi:hypothetical protein
MIHPRYLRQDPLCTIAEIPIRSRQIQKIRNVLNLYGVPQIGPAGGHGWIQGEGSIQISGSNTAVTKAVDAILLAINGPKWQNGAEIYARQKQGAMQ